MLAPPMNLDVGQLINGRYRLIRMIGDGGMGTVFEARHELLGTTVALKFLHPHLARKQEVAERFLQEAQVSASIVNPHVVRTTDVDRDADGLAYMVMELVNGDTLLDTYERLRAAGKWVEQEMAFDYILQILEGVEAAHEKGVVHRDLKPENVMIEISESGRGVLRILDFGVAKLDVGSGMARGLTLPGMVMGTPEYMAPEQALAASAADVRADVFSLGVMLYELLAGSTPVRGPMLAIIDAFKSGAYPPLNSVAEVDAHLAAAVHRAIAGDPAERFATVAAFREAITACIPRETLSSLPPSVRLGRRSSARITAPSTPPPAPPPQRLAATLPGDTEHQPTQFEAPLAAPVPRMESAPPPGSLVPAPPPTRRSRSGGGSRVWAGALLVAIAAGTATVIFWPRFTESWRSLDGDDDARARDEEDDGDPEPVPSAVVVPSTSTSETPPPPPPEPAVALRQVEGSWGGRRYMLRYAENRSEDGAATFEVAIEQGNTALELRRVSMAAEYFADHRKTIYQRGDLSSAAHRFTIGLARDGKYHVTVTASTSGGAAVFRCDVCLGGAGLRCPNLRARCSPPVSGGGHHHH